MTAEPLEIFYSYADASFLDTLAKHLAILHKQGHIKPWSNQDIRPGSLWEQAINIHFQKAHIILLLISSDFIASEHCSSPQLQQAIKRQHAGDVIVIPILLRPCDWQTAPFGELLALPRNGQPVRAC
jgi:hypothetical protein